MIVDPGFTGESSTVQIGPFFGADPHTVTVKPGVGVVQVSCHGSRLFPFKGDPYVVAGKALGDLCRDHPLEGVDLLFGPGLAEVDDEGAVTAYRSAAEWTIISAQRVDTGVLDSIGRLVLLGRRVALVTVEWDIDLLRDALVSTSVMPAVSEAAGAVTVEFYPEGRPTI